MANGELDYEKSFWDKSWKERSLGGKAAYVGTMFTPVGWAGIGINEARKAMGGETKKTTIARNAAETQRMIEESQRSPYNEAKISKENIDYYNKVLADYSRAMIS